MQLTKRPIRFIRSLLSAKAAAPARQQAMGPLVLEPQQLRLIAGGVTDVPELPKGGW